MTGAGAPSAPRSTPQLTPNLNPTLTLTQTSARPPSLLRKDDFICSTYRDHVHALSKNVPAREIMAELFGKKTGICRGQGGSMHMFNKEHGLLGGFAFIGEGIPIGLGAAFQIKYRREVLGDETADGVAVNFFGDGTCNVGQARDGGQGRAWVFMVWGTPALPARTTPRRPRARTPSTPSLDSVVLRVPEHGVPVQAALHLCRRKQQVGDRHAARARHRAVGGRRGAIHLQKGARLWHAWRAGGRHGRAEGARGRGRGDRACSPRRRPHPDRGGDVPLPGPLPGRPR